MNDSDSSALLVSVQREDGLAAIEPSRIRARCGGGVCGAANWSEVAQKVLGHGRDWTLSRALLQSYGLVIEPVPVDDAEWAARRWRSGQPLSLADRHCVAFGDRLDAPVLTADRAWGTSGHLRQIR